MLKAAFFLFVLTVVAAVFGFGGVAGVSAGTAKLTYVSFLLLAVVSLLRDKALPQL